MKNSTRYLLDLIEAAQKYKTARDTGSPWDISGLSAELRETEERFLESIRTELKESDPWTP